jgi:NAD(P)-dependent dehydrogenase (short-subunit alcohol dehydrogenase family)
MTKQGTILVTGASTGIGRACAELLADSGFEVFGTVRNKQDGETLRSHESGRVHPVVLDVTDGEQIRQGVAAIEKHVGDRGLAGLVNNAGIALGGPLEYVPSETIRRQFDVNVFGLLDITRALLPMIRRAKGRIVNIGSASGYFTTPFLGPYCASKYAVEAFTDAMRGELYPFGIHVSVVQPGRILTPIWDRGLEEADRMRTDLAPEGVEHYGHYLEGVETLIKTAKKEGIPPLKVALRVRHALTARRPKTRYIVGLDARLQKIVKKLLPTRLLDRLVLFMLRKGYL